MCQIASVAMHRLASSRDDIIAGCVEAQFVLSARLIKLPGLMALKRFGPVDFATVVS